MSSPKISIVIPAKGLNSSLEECIEHCLQLNYPEFEVIVLPDSPVVLPYPNVIVIPTGTLGPSEKRDKALSDSDGDIIAFLDDDAFPRRDWLRNAVMYFDENKVAAVGGPAITPESDNFLQKASGLVYSSFLGGGSVGYRYVPKTQREVDDYPSCNFLVRKSVMEELGGFNCKFWPGEDTKLCKEITNDLNMKIIYAPEVLVYHHRRSLFGPHLRQVWSYALHRGYFVKRFPETSLRLGYFLPSILVLAIVAGLSLAFGYPRLRVAYISLLILYVLAVLIDGFRGKTLRMGTVVSLGIIATHFAYGIGFLKGLFSRRLKEEID
jgi:cellulose synthase/poly-beta-1,6-N-acetylglucosamine synthase-like glycosyltransferase